MKQGIQTNFQDEMIKKYGCYFLSLLRWAEIERGALMPASQFEFSNYDIQKMYIDLVHRGYMRTNCYINDPVAVLNYALGENKYKKVMWADGSKIPEQALFITLLKKPDHEHFVLGDQVNVRLWDPLDPERPAAKEYKVDSYRVIT